MQDGPNAKQLIAEKIKQSANILVTVSANPSVDALTAALGLSLMLNKLDKHATAVFSGVVPPAISFLQPNKTFENNVDSLRDFIIALDKDKADRLRYKVENDVVRIFITPYRTKISQKDLQFSQGDFNVDLIVALGVEDQKDLDQAITAHGRILHDATVATINPSSQKSSLGSIDWQDGKASSLSEMVASIADSLKQGILDQQISTALLTGIVASTERFSNQLTTPHVMTVAAGLMAAGANQQLIATKLQSIPAPVSPRREKPKQSDKPAAPDDSAAAGADGEMHINHGEQEEAPAELPKEQPKPAPAPAPEVEPESEVEPAEPEPQEEPELPIAPPAAQNFDDLKQAIKEDTAKPEVHHEMVQEPPTPGNHNINAEEADEVKPKSDEESYLTTHPSWMGREIEPPTMGGTLSATAEQALEDKQREEAEEHRNHKILTHGNPGESEEQPTGQQQPKKSRRQKQKQQQQAAPKPASVPAPAAEPVPAPPAPEPVVAPVPEPTPEAQPPAPAPEESQPAAVAEEPSLPPLPAPAPMPEPIAAPEPAPAPAPTPPEPEIPIAPPPLVVSEPLTQPTPAPQASAPNTGAMSLPPVPSAPMPPTPETQSAGPVHGEPTLEELERQAAHHAAQAAEGAPQTLSELEAAARGHAAAVPSPTPEPAPTPAPAVPAAPPMPDFSTLPPLPGAGPMPPQPQTPQLPPLPPDTQPVPEPEKPQAPPDPAQFRIPTQQ